MTAKTEEVPAPPEVAMGDILKAIQDISGRVDALAAEQARATPRFAPMQREVKPLQPEAPNVRATLKGMAVGEARDGDRQIPVDYKGHKVDTNRYRQLFRAGQTVRINRDASRGTCRVINHPAQLVTADDGRQHLVAPAHRELIPMNWGEVIDGLSGGGFITCPTKLDEGGAICGTRTKVGTPCEQCGAGPTVRGARQLTKAGEWKYMVRVPGLTRHAGDGFLEWEILPA
jgi:hypothetical protein